MKYLSKNKHWQLTEDYNIDKILYLLIDRPHIKDNIGFVWINHRKQFHRDYDLPTVINDGGYLAWWRNDKRHKEKFV